MHAVIAAVVLPAVEVALRHDHFRAAKTFSAVVFHGFSIIIRPAPCPRVGRGGKYERVEREKLNDLHLARSLRRAALIKPPPVQVVNFNEESKVQHLGDKWRKNILLRL